MSLSRQVPIESDRRVEARDLPHEGRLIELWEAWLFAEAEAALALGDWSCAPEGEKSPAYTAYRAALDREEEAAVLLERSAVAASHSLAAAGFDTRGEHDG